MQKFKLTDLTREHNGVTLYCIEALRDIDNPAMFVAKGDKGGWVESTDNLSQLGDCWIGNDAIAMKGARVTDASCLYGNAFATDNVLLEDEATAFGNARLYDNVRLSEKASACGNAYLCNNTEVCGEATVSGDAFLSEDTVVGGKATITGTAILGGHVCIEEEVVIDKSIVRSWPKK